MINIRTGIPARRQIKVHETKQIRTLMLTNKISKEELTEARKTKRSIIAPK